VELALLSYAGLFIRRTDMGAIGGGFGRDIDWYATTPAIGERQQGSSPDEPAKPEEAQAESPLITCPAIQNAVKLKRLL
jgi:hypothetical protein